MDAGDQQRIDLALAWMDREDMQGQQWHHGKKEKHKAEVSALIDALMRGGWMDHRRPVDVNDEYMKQEAPVFAVLMDAGYMSKEKRQQGVGPKVVRSRPHEEK